MVIMEECLKEFATIYTQATGNSLILLAPEMHRLPASTTTVGDGFLSLVTCSYFDDDARIFVHAIREPVEAS